MASSSIPLPVSLTLVSLNARWREEAIQVNWGTAGEVNNLGFNLYRRELGRETHTQLNESLIPSASPGGQQGASYQFIDSGVMPGVTYEYLLEDVDFRGLRTQHGPVVAMAPYAIFLPLVTR